MVLHSTIADRLGQLKEYVWWFTDLEFALEMLNDLSSKRKTVFSAQLIDAWQLINLPLNAPDGNTISSLIRPLESEWQQLLG